MDSNCISVCTLPVHTLLHIAQNIQEVGPVWSYWAFPMEQYCGSLALSAKNKRFPYISISNCIRDISQLNEIKIFYSLTESLDLSDKKNHNTLHSITYPECKYLLFIIYTYHLQV
jgi:hypothetical protein